jgi:hypothetical protein
VSFTPNLLVRGTVTAITRNTVEIDGKAYTLPEQAWSRRWLKVGMTVEAEPLFGMRGGSRRRCRRRESSLR